MVVYSDNANKSPPSLSLSLYSPCKWQSREVWPHSGVETSLQRNVGKGKRRTIGSHSLSSQSWLVGMPVGIEGAESLIAVMFIKLIICITIISETFVLCN